MPSSVILTLPGSQSPTHWPSDDVLIFENGNPSDLWIVDPSSDSPVAREYVYMVVNWFTVLKALMGN